MKNSIKESHILKVLGPLKKWRHQCHTASIHLVRAGIGDRVARGGCKGVIANHSWVVCGYDCYDTRTTIIDPTLWSYDKSVSGIFIGKASVHGHTPHSAGSIWEWGKPLPGNGRVIKLKPKLSSEAEAFMSMVGPLDKDGWFRLSSAPVGGWPAAEIFEAMESTPALRCMVPIDVIGMLTFRNPMKVYLREGDTGK